MVLGSLHCQKLWLFHRHLLVRVFSVLDKENPIEILSIFCIIITSQITDLLLNDPILLLLGLEKQAALMNSWLCIVTISVVQNYGCNYLIQSPGVTSYFCLQFGKF